MPQTATAVMSSLFRNVPHFASIEMSLFVSLRGRPAGGALQPVAVARFPLSQFLFGTARSRQGRALFARRRKIFSVFEKIFRSAPLTARTVPEPGAEGKAGRGSRGFPPGGVR